MVEGRLHCGVKLADTKRLILQAFHDHPMAGHYGVTKTLKAVKGRFYWPNADSEVTTYVTVLAVRYRQLILLSQLVYCSPLMCHRILGPLS